LNENLHVTADISAQFVNELLAAKLINHHNKIWSHKKCSRMPKSPEKSRIWTLH